MWFLGMDVGTGGTRAVVVDGEGKLIAGSSCEHAPFRAEHPVLRKTSWRGCHSQLGRPQRGGAAVAPISSPTCALHGETHQKPQDLFELEKSKLRPLTLRPYDLAAVTTVHHRRCRVTLDTNHYSVPPRYAGTNFTLKVYPQSLPLRIVANLLEQQGTSIHPAGSIASDPPTGFAGTGPARPQPLAL